MDLPKRKSPRLKKYDYSTPGYYFVTICTKDKQKLLCDIVGEGLCALPTIRLSNIGEQVKNSIEWINSNYTDIKVDKYVIMPNHIHLIIAKLPMPCYRENLETGGHGDPPLHCEVNIGVDDVIARLKSYTTLKNGKELWQRSFHDHIIRGKKDYQKIWEYIDTNPARWEYDCFYI